MGKRCIVIFLALLFAFSGICARLAYLMVYKPIAVGSLSGNLVVEFSQNRGAVYDCNGERLVDEKKIKFAALTKELLPEFIKKGGELSEDELTQLNSGIPVMVKVDNDFVCDNVSFFYGNERYSSLSAATHIVGYLNYEGHGISGIEKSFEELLNGGKKSVRFMRNASGEILKGIGAQQIADEKTGSVQLTLDKTIQKSIETIGSKYIKTGAVVVLDNYSGKIRAMASFPTFDRNYVANSLNNNDKPFINRALSEFSCGSVFKLSIAAAALESNGMCNYNCSGNMNVGGVSFGCMKKHGMQNLYKAIANSCNTYFINLGQKTGADAVYRMARLMGFNSENILASGISDVSGSLNSLDDLMNNPASLANFSFGQGEVMTTPLQIASMIQCIVNKGKRIIPTLVESTTDKEGNTIKTKIKSPVNVMSEKNAEILYDCMMETMISGTGKTSKPKGCVSGGKTATAQTGRFDADGNEYLQTWFAGFAENDNYSYTIVVMVENGVTGGQSAGPVFLEIAEKIF